MDLFFYPSVLLIFFAVYVSDSQQEDKTYSNQQKLLEDSNAEPSLNSLMHLFADVAPELIKLRKEIDLERREQLLSSEKRSLLPNCKDITSSRCHRTRHQMKHRQPNDKIYGHSPLQRKLTDGVSYFPIRYPFENKDHASKFDSKRSFTSPRAILLKNHGDRVFTEMSSKDTEEKGTGAGILDSILNFFSKGSTTETNMILDPNGGFILPTSTRRPKHPFERTKTLIKFNHKRTNRQLRGSKAENSSSTTESDGVIEILLEPLPTSTRETAGNIENQSTSYVTPTVREVVYENNFERDNKGNESATDGPMKEKESFSNHPVMNKAISNVTFPDESNNPLSNNMTQTAQFKREAQVIVIPDIHAEDIFKDIQNDIHNFFEKSNDKSVIRNDPVDIKTIFQDDTFSDVINDIDRINNRGKQNKNKRYFKGNYSNKVINKDKNYTSEPIFELILFNRIKKSQDQISTETSKTHDSETQAHGILYTTHISNMSLIGQQDKPFSHELETIDTSQKLEDNNHFDTSKHAKRKHERKGSNYIDPNQLQEPKNEKDIWNSPNFEQLRSYAISPRTFADTDIEMNLRNPMRQGEMIDKPTHIPNAVYKWIFYNPQIAEDILQTFHNIRTSIGKRDDEEQVQESPNQYENDSTLVYSTPIQTTEEYHNDSTKEGLLEQMLTTLNLLSKLMFNDGKVTNISESSLNKRIEDIKRDFNDSKTPEPRELLEISTTNGETTINLSPIYAQNLPHEAVARDTIQTPISSNSNAPISTKYGVSILHDGEKQQGNIYQRDLDPLKDDMWLEGLERELRNKNRYPIAPRNRKGLSKGYKESNASPMGPEKLREQDIMEKHTSNKKVKVKHFMKHGHSDRKDCVENNRNRRRRNGCKLKKRHRLNGL